MANDEDAATQVFTDMRWIAPVETVADLPGEGVAERTLCFVSATGEIYRFEQGRWELESKG